MAMCVASIAFPAAAAEPVPPRPLQATLVCAPIREPGRVRCEVEARVSGGTIRWADAEITSVPDFVASLKGRIGPHDATTRDATTWRFALGLVAKRSGSGTVKARVRAVACTDAQGETCTPLVVVATAEVRAGT
jgi:hypothetical protein